jgi:polyisoprenoid-binding protein YceI
MRLRFALLSTASIVVTAALASAPRAADTYTVDGVHSWVVYRIKHMGLANSFGMFKDVSGSFTTDEAAPQNSKFEFTVKADSVDSANPKRDQHLKSPDFFSAREFPTITFKSKKVSKSADGGYQVVGDLTLHGVTKEISFTIDKIGSAKDPRGMTKAGFSADVAIKRSDFGIKQFPGMLGEDVLLMVGIEGNLKR